MSNFSLLFNEFALLHAQSINVLDGVTSSGHNPSSIMDGNRATCWKSEPTSNASIAYSGVPYNYGSNKYIYIVRADLLQSKTVSGSTVTFRRESDSTITTSQLDLSENNLCGINNQDAVFSGVNVALDDHTLGLEFTPSGATACYLHELMVCYDFNLDVEPSPGATWIEFEPFDFQPLRGDEKFSVEGRCILNFNGLYFSEIELMMNLPGLLENPVVLVDHSRSLWPHLTEHVIIEKWFANQRGGERFDLELHVLRLKQYQ